MRNYFSTQSLNVSISWVQIAALLVMTFLPLLANAQQVNAYTGEQITSRSIQMSDPGPSDTSTYEVDFLLGSNHNIASIVLQTCSDSPIIGDSTCGAESGFSWSGVSIDNEDNVTLGAMSTSANTDADTLVVDVDGGATAMSASDQITFEVTGVTNPDNTGTFYVRILTFSSTTDADSYATNGAGNDGSAVDAGGIALSVTDDLVVTAKVQESLTFTVNQTAVSLGDANGVLSSSTQYTDSTTTLSLATNAQGGVDVVATADGTLTSGSNTIDAIGTSCTAGSTGTEQFGFRVDDSGSSAITASAPYNCSTGNWGFDTSALAVGSGGAGDTAFGDVIATTSGATATDTADVEFVGNIANTTEAGVYTSTMTFTATATF